MRYSLATLLFFGMSCYLYAASPALTIYNQDFAVIRDLVPLSLKSGLNHVEYSGMTANAEPDSVILRDPIGKVTWQIIEQNYRKDAASVDRMLELYEGKTIQFQLQDGKTVSGRILRAQTRPATSSGTMAGIANQPVVTEKPFDDYHLYQLANRTTLLDSETKQVEFVRANSITTKRIYLYDGADLSRYTNMYSGYVGYEQIRNNSEYGTEMNPKVWVMREFVNSAANHLGIPLPKGRLRFYRQDTGGQLEFTGENEIDHTPKDETVRVFTGAAFDVAGSRKRTQYHNDFQRREADESFEVSVRNRKASPVAVTVREHLYRGANWNILSETDSHAQRDSNMIEFPIDVAANSEKIVRYSVHYTW
jgi:hypothetical protein